MDKVLKVAAMRNFNLASLSYLQQADCPALHLQGSSTGLNDKFGENMNHRILPGAAGLIALTATIGFTDWYRELEIESFSRNTISLVSIQLDGAVDSTLANQQPANRSAKHAYLVEIRRGNTTAEVTIDARTGKILSA